MRFGQGAAAFALAAAVAAGLSGCIAPRSVPAVSAPAPAVSVPPAEVATPSSAPATEARLRRTAFDAALRPAAAASRPDGAAAVAALEAAGFPAATLEVTASTTSAGLVPGSVTVAALVGAQCLIGQFGAAVDGYHSTIAPPLGSGGCLVGGTAPLG